MSPALLLLVHFVCIYLMDTLYKQNAFYEIKNEANTEMITLYSLPNLNQFE